MHIVATHHGTSVRIITYQYMALYHSLTSHIQHPNQSRNECSKPTTGCHGRFMAARVSHVLR